MFPSHPSAPPVVLAAAAHPDDIEFLFAGTLLLLKEAGCSIHMWNLANGCCGSMLHNTEETVRIRREEAMASAQLAGAAYHESLFNDMEVFYDRPSLASVAKVIRSIRPQIILTHSPHDYMEDHQNVCRLIVSAAFARSMPNFPVDHVPCDEPARIYHAAPHGLRDALENPFIPGLLIDISSVLEKKRTMLACHRSQQSWLQETQGLNAYLDEMVSMAHSMAAFGKQWQFAEGWRRHSHLGFCTPDYDPLSQWLGEFCSQTSDTPKEYAQTT